MAVSKTMALLASSIAIAYMLSEPPYPNGNTIVSKTVTSVEDPETVNIGETIEAGKFEITVVDAYVTDERYEYEGVNYDKVLAVEVEFRNNSDRSSTPAYDFTMYGDDRKLEEYRFAGAGSSMVSPGRIGDFKLGYVIPDGVEELELEYLSYDESYNETFYIFKFEIEE